MKLRRTLLLLLSYLCLVPSANAQLLIDTFAGANGPNGIQATLAGIGAPRSIALDGSGDFFIADVQNHRINKVNTITGVISTVAGNGFSGFCGDGGPAAAACLSFPSGVAVDVSGNLFIADTSNHRIRKVDTGGIITTVVGTGVPGFSGDGGPANSARLNNPFSVAVDASGNLFIADVANHRIRKVAGGNITTVAGTGGIGFSGDGGAATSAMLNAPFLVAVDNLGNLFIGDTNNQRIRKVDTGGIITTVAGTGVQGFSGDGGPANSARLNNPFGVAADGSGNLFIGDTSNNRVRKVAGGIISTVAGNGVNGFSGDGGTATAASLKGPRGVAVDSLGNLFIADVENSRIRTVNTGGTITTVAGNGTINFCGSGIAALDACLHSPGHVAVDVSGNLFIADTSNHRIRKVDVGGIITTVAGTGAPGFSGDGGPATAAQLQTPLGVAVDNLGNLFIADFNNNRVRKVDTSTGIITTVAGTGVFGFSGDGGPATSARLLQPHGVGLDSSNNLYIGDQGNNRVRKVDASTGIITTVAGSGVFGFSGDGGPATSASLKSPRGVALDSSNNLYIADLNNQRIRKVEASTSVITTFVGNGISGSSGDGGLATEASLAQPVDVALDSSGNLFIADLSNNRVRKVDASTGIITTVAGSGVFGFSGDGGPATSASLANPSGVTLDSSGNLFIADRNNNRVRVAFSPNIAPVASAGGPYSVNEGGTVTLNAGGSSDPDGDALTYEWDLNYNGVTFAPTSGVTGATPTVSAAGLDGPTDSRTIAVRVSDGSLTTVATALLNVVNVPPVITGVTVPLAPQPLGATTNVSAPFTDAGTLDTHTCTIDWDNGSGPVAATVTEAAGAGTCTGSRTFTAAGVYTVTVKVADDDSDVASRNATDLIVVYDPSAGFVTGGGWINSWAGAYVPDATLSGKANFGFVSKYKKGATTPTGVTEFQFQVANFNFHSSIYEWLVVSGAKAQYKGTGTVNGAGNYGFLLTATDGQISGGGGVDKFRIKIWDKTSGDVVVYDNAPGSDDINASPMQGIGGGSIVIHK